MSAVAHRPRVKLYIDGESPAPDVLVPVLHRWIQRNALSEPLIDVIDYSHVPRGPGVLLVTHEAHYSVDQADGRPGLVYARKRGGPDGDLTAQLADALTHALHAAEQLEGEPELAGRLRFVRTELELGVVARVATPSVEELRRAAEGALQLARVGTLKAATRIGDERAPLTLRVELG